MANFIKMAIVQSILSLHAQGLSARQIARTLSIGRETVARCLRRHRQAVSNEAIAPIDPGRVGLASRGASDATSNEAIAPTGSGRPELPAESTQSSPALAEKAVGGPLSKAARWRDFILQK